MPMGWRIARVVVPLVCVLASVGVFPLTHPHWAEAQDFIQHLSATKSFLLASAMIVLLTPCRDSDLIVGSRTGILIPQLKTFAGNLFVGVSVAVVNFCMAFARVAEWDAYLLYAIVMVCACALPFFYRLPLWRVIGAVALVMGALIPFHAANFW